MAEITIKEVAKLCGVGVSTVSRAINNHPDINPETKAAIMKIISDHNYIPNNSARNLKRTDAKTIAILVKGISNPFFSSMIKIMEETIKKRKYTLVLHHVKANEDEVDVALELVKEKRLRGIVFLGGYFHHSDDKLENLKVPFVLSTVGGSPETINRSNYSSISVDDEKESYEVTKYLIEQGHRKIAILSAPMNDASIGRLRYVGYARALLEAGISINEKLVCCMSNDAVDYSMENGFELTRKLLETKEEFSALFAISDNMAVGACKAIFEAGKKIPQDYSVVGYDGIAIGKYYNPSITTMAQPIDEMALATINLLFEVIDDKKAHSHKVFQAKLVERESTRKL